MCHLRDNNLINAAQHGLLDKRSCDTCQLSFFDHVLQSRDSGFAINTVYFDFTKAFDRVDHDLLLLKLASFGIGHLPKLLGVDSVKLSSVLMAFTDSESCAGLHAEGNIAGSADLNRLISQSTAKSRSPTYLLVQNTGSVTLNGEVLHRAPVLTRPCPEL
ncbi:unnamed protein product [Schistocephalus solidus]|uniref:Reverse transcriptase domain-containing protein n=1 Tax=Schistocephalus solidus TaxID=70667 RepID=A0A183TKS1_SCHSO|nr:unnamed protein product [Schistocephalus solidus]